LTRDYGVIAPHARTSSNGGSAIAAAGYGIAGREPSAGAGDVRRTEGELAAHMTAERASNTGVTGRRGWALK
jgi:hypothetical protein